MHQNDSLGRFSFKLDLNIGLIRAETFSDRPFAGANLCGNILVFHYTNHTPRSKLLISKSQKMAQLKLFHNSKQTSIGSFPNPEC